MPPSRKFNVDGGQNITLSGSKYIKYYVLFVVGLGYIIYSTRISLPVLVHKCTTQTYKSMNTLCYVSLGQYGCNCNKMQSY